MKKSLFIIGLFVISCSSPDESNIAFGHFEAREVIVGPETAGKLTQYRIEEGMTISKGDTLAVIDTTQLHIQKKQAEASIEAVRAKTLSVNSEIAVLEANKEYIQSELQRLDKLVKAEAATQMQFDEMKAKEEQVARQIQALKIKLNNTNRGILAEIEPLKLRVKQTEDLIRKSIILSPISGTVLSRYSSLSEMAMPGKPLCTMADLDKLELRVYMTSKQLDGIVVGTDVKVAYTSSEEILSGKVISVASEAEFTPKNVQTADEKENLVYGVVVSVSNNGKLRIGMPGNIIISND